MCTGRWGPEPWFRVQEVHDDDALSRASSASSSPRYSAVLMAQVAAAMAASAGHQVGSPTGAAMQSYIRAQQQQRQQLTAMGQGFGQNVPGLGAGSGLGGSTYGALRPSAGASSGTPPRLAYGPQRHGPLAPHASAWTQQGELPLNVLSLLCCACWCSFQLF